MTVNLAPHLKRIEVGDLVEYKDELAYIFEVRIN